MTLKKNMKTLKVGIIGFGGSGIAQYFHFYNRIDTEVVVIYDIKNESLNRASQLIAKNGHKSIILTTKLEDFFSNTIDIVAICSPDNTHARYIEICVGNKKHVICEKPLCDSIEDCKKLYQLSIQNPNLVIAVQHQMRYIPLFEKVKQIIDSGDLGDISYIEGFYVHNLKERASLYDNWRFNDNATPLVYCGCHFVDLFRWLLNEEVVEISAMANNISFIDYPESDLNVVQLRFKSGIIANITIAFGAGKPQDHSIKVYGTKKCIENNLLIDRKGDSKILINPNLKLMLNKKQLNLKAKILGTILLINASIFGFCFYILKNVLKLPSEYILYSNPIAPYEHELAVTYSINEFINAIIEKRKPICNIDEGIKTVITCLAGVESYRSGKKVQIDINSYKF